MYTRIKKGENMKKLKSLLLAFLLVPVLILATACGGVAIPDWANNPPATAEEFVALLIEKGYTDAVLEDGEITGTLEEGGKTFVVSVTVFADAEQAGLSFFLAKGMLQGMVDYLNWTTEEAEEGMEMLKSLNFSFGSDYMTVSGTVEIPGETEGTTISEEVSMFMKLSGKYLITGGCGSFDILDGMGGIG